MQGNLNRYTGCIKPLLGLACTALAQPRPTLMLPFKAPWWQWPQRLLQWFHAQHFGERAIDPRYALAEACLIGIVSALAALLLKQGIGWLGGLRLQLASHWGGLALPIYGGLLAALAGLLIERAAPAAAGSGIPHVKAVLANFEVPLSLRVGLVKLVGTTLLLGAGIPLGRRGPTVHIGAALAAELSNWLPTSPQHRRHTIAAGAAAGLAAGFNTPIAGVLFVVEELSRDMSGLTLETAIFASFTGSIVSRLLGASLLPSGLASSYFHPPEMPAYLLLGLLAGGLGALFNRGVLTSLACNRRLRWPMAVRVGGVGLVIGGILAIVPPEFRDNTGLREILMTGAAHWQQTALIFAAHFSLTILAYGTGAPGGIFAPALLMGSALGYLVGTGAVALSGTGSEVTYALVGMGAFFTGVARVPVTAIVIVFELTADFGLVLPLMMSCGIAYLIGEAVFKGSLYQHLLEASGIDLKDDATAYDNDPLVRLVAADVMQRRVETLAADLTLAEAIQAFARSRHHGFPVLDHGRMIGMITDSDLAHQRHQPGHLKLHEIISGRPVTLVPTAPLKDVMYLMDRYHLSHLPVLDGQMLVGIVTRSDLIHAAAEQLEPQRATPTVEPSYVVYVTRSPASGKGRLLLPLSNPDTAPALLEIALALAQQQQYELECLHAIAVPRHCSPAQTPVDLTASQQLFVTARRLADRAAVPLHLQVRVAQDRAQAILEAIAERHINLLVTGWKGSTTAPDRVFGTIADTLIHQARCPLVLVKLGRAPAAYPYHPGPGTRWLVPTAGGPNADLATQLLPALARLTAGPQIWLTQIYPPQAQPEAKNLEQLAANLRRHLPGNIETLAIRAASVSEAAIRFADRQACDVVLLGASRESLLKQVVLGNIPEAIATGVTCTAIVVRGPLAASESSP